MNKIVLALAIMTATGAITANAVGLAYAVNPQPLPPGIIQLQQHPPQPCQPAAATCTIPPQGLLAHYPHPVTTPP
jgi:hypothetical protein